jgi:hypothetical protein
MQAAEIAAVGGNRIGEAARQDMEDRFFFDRIDMLGDDPTIYEADQPISATNPYPAYPSSAVAEFAVMGADLAFNGTIFKS